MTLVVGLVCLKVIVSMLCTFFYVISDRNETDLLDVIAF